MRLVHAQLQQQGIGKIIALAKNPVAVINKARRNLEKLRKLHPDVSALFEEWEHWLDLPADTLAEKIQSPELQAREMRQVSPFSGILSARERVRILKDFRDEQHS